MTGYFQNHTTWKEMLGKGKSIYKKKSIGAFAAKGWKKRLEKVKTRNQGGGG